MNSGDESRTMWFKMMANDGAIFDWSHHVYRSNNVSAKKRNRLFALSVLSLVVMNFIVGCHIQSFSNFLNFCCYFITTHLENNSHCTLGRVRTSYFLLWYTSHLLLLFYLSLAPQDIGHFWGLVKIRIEYGTLIRKHNVQRRLLFQHNLEDSHQKVLHFTFWIDAPLCFGVLVSCYVFCLHLSRSRWPVWNFKVY